MAHKPEDEIEVVFEGITFEAKEHLWQYDDQGKAMMDAIYGMISSLCPGCQLKALSMICAATICDIQDEGQESFRDILFKCINDARTEINSENTLN